MDERRRRSRKEEDDWNISLNAPANGPDEEGVNGAQGERKELNKGE